MHMSSFTLITGNTARVYGRYPEDVLVRSRVKDLVEGEVRIT